MDTRPKFGKIERLANEVFGPGLQRSQLMVGLCSDDDHWYVTVNLNLLKPFQHLKAVHAGHLEIEQDQAVWILLMKLAYLIRMSGGIDGRVSRNAEHPLYQLNVRVFVVNDQNSRLQDIARTNHSVRPDYSPATTLREADSSAASSVAMNSAILIGLVR